MKFNLATTLAEAGRLWGDHTMLFFEDETYTYREISARSAAFAASLRNAGVQPGDHITIQLPNVPEFVTSYFGALWAGAVVVPINPLLSPDEVVTIMQDCDSKILISASEDAVRAVTQNRSLADVQVRGFEIEEQFAEPISEWENHAETVDRPSRVDGNQTAFIIYTSGTTGRPKGAEISHLQAYLSCAAESDMLSISSNDIILAVLPLFHVFGLSSILNAGVLKGEAFVLMRRFDPKALAEAIDSHKITILAGVPTMYFELLAIDRSTLDMSSVRIIISGGAPMPIEVIRRIENEFPAADYVEGYGMSESTASGTLNGGVFERRLGSIGRAVWGVEVKVIDSLGAELPPGEENVGELVLRGVNIMKGYFKNPEATAETVKDGWLHTGDLAYRDADDYFFVVGRVKDLIIRGGYNVHPRDVEEVIYELDGIDQVAVVGRPDQRLGEEVVAFVVGDEKVINADQISEHCRARLARYKWPREIHFLENLPKGPTGKIRKEALVAQAAQTN